MNYKAAYKTVLVALLSSPPPESDTTFPLLSTLFKIPHQKTSNFSLALKQTHKMQYNTGITLINEPRTNDLEAFSRVNDRLENE